MRDNNAFIEESNLIYLIDRFASQEDISECQQSNQDGKSDEKEALANFLKSSTIKKKILKNVFIKDVLIKLLEELIHLNIQQTSLQVLSLMSIQEKF